MLFGVDIAKEISDAFSGELEDVTLTRDNPGTYDPLTDSYSGGGTPSTFTSEGIVQKYDKKLIADGVVQRNDREILILAEPLGTVPSNGGDNRKADSIEIEGETFTVVSVDKDPATATYIVQGRL